MKRILSTLIVVTMFVTMLCSPAVMADGGIPVYIDGAPIVSDVPAQIISDRTMVPLRAIFEALGAEVTWDNDTRTAISNRDGVEIKITIGENRLFKNDTEVALDVPAQIVDSRTLVPVRAIAESYDCKVFWDGDNRLVRILTFDIPAAELTADDENIVMTVGNIAVSQAELNIYKAAIRELSADFTEEEINEYATDVAERYCATQLLAQKKGISLSDVEKDEVDAAINYLMTAGVYENMLTNYETSDTAMRNFLRNSKIADIVNSTKYEFTDEEILAAAKENYVRVKHILVKELDTAEKVISEINAGKSFEDAATEYSLDGMNVEIGYVFGLGEMVEEFETASFELEEGKMSGAVQTVYGYHIIKAYPLAEVSDYILTHKRAELEYILTQERILQELDAAVEEANFAQTLAGSVSNDVYENKFISLGFKLPDETWEFFDGDSIAAIRELSGKIFKNTVDYSGIITIMSAGCKSGSFMGSSVNIQLEKMPEEFPPIEELVNSSEQIVSSMLEMVGDSVSISDLKTSTVEFGDEKYFTFSYEIEMMGVTLYSTQILVNKGEYLFTITMMSGDPDYVNTIFDGYFVL